MKYTVEQVKTIRITYEKGSKKLEIEVPIDFEPTKEWLDFKAESYNITKCEEWLKKKGFYQEENGRWSYTGIKKRSKKIDLPMFFFCIEKGTLYVSFEKIIGVDIFIMPRAIGIGSSGRISYLKTLQNLPRETDAKITYWEEYKVEADFYNCMIRNDYDIELYPKEVHHLVGKGIKNYHKDFFTYLVCIKDSETIRNINWPESLIDSLNEEEKNIFNSIKAIYKFQL